MSASSRDRVLGRIRAGLHANRASLQEHAAQHPPPHPRGPVIAVAPGTSDVALFERELTALRGTVHVCDSADAALSTMLSILADAGAARVLAWAEDELPLAGVYEALDARGIARVDGRLLGDTSREARLAGLDDVPACITGADAAVAESGSFALASGPGRGRLASLLPPLHIALLPASRIVRSLADALDLLHHEFGPALFRDRSNVVFVTGPSRTADIELSLTLGVHGPREVHVIILG
jgi:L-lactate dehydrogenase complex protein LldG